MLASQIKKSWRYPVTHRSRSSLQNYHNMPSVQQLCKCSNLLTVALGDDRVQTTADQLVANKRRPPLQQLQVSFVNTANSSTQQNTAAFSQMFSSCTIGNIHVYYYKPFLFLFNRVHYLSQIVEILLFAFLFHV